ncbi:MAG: TraB/GumN family protein, partial [Lawsonibacter sp.]|nr:TraB/GumN family protein [Lawsonibacter sp.]MCI9567980.1 TraB/GumN family protein [Lawsonibacter sp.]
RDPNMIAWADRYLKQDGAHTGLMTVGAGHMIGRTGVVQGLKDLGYTVEVVPAP